MSEKKEERIKELSSPKIVPDIIEKKMKIQHDGSQYSIRIPAILIEELNIKKGDVIIFKYNSKDKSYSIKFENGKKKV